MVWDGKLYYQITQGPKYGKPLKPVSLEEQLELYDSLLPSAQKVIKERIKDEDLTKKILYIDMDDTICQFTPAVKKMLESNPDIKFPQSVPGFF